MNAAELNQRNTESIRAALARLEAEVHRQGAEVVALQGSISTLVSEVQRLNTELTALRAQGRGNGPTERR